MKEYKRIKDPIYGYIKVPTEYMTEIVDTANFQRLRRIIQTSYSPLYSSALHNRFVHSMGVYYLGDMASKQLISEIANKKDIKTINMDLDKYGEIFKLACLLHDVGHAPFSHTGESFYLGEDRDYNEIHNKLSDVISSEEFKRDIPVNKSLWAAPHEIMSSIIGVMQYKKFMKNTEEKEFFARCITGYKYSSNTLENSIKNCFVSLLNSKVIDVDKLDYLIRDAYVTGFDTVNIDFERLLTSITVLFTEQGDCEVAYYKNAISVIENVVYAHDAERKWIQTHPIVLYEGYIIQHIISYLDEQTRDGDKKLFSLNSLLKEGVELKDNLFISLLCDDDIIFLIKNFYRNELGIEFFERRERRHPVWKSEAEYKAFLLGLVEGGMVLNRFEKAMDTTSKYLTKSTESWVIDEELIKKLEDEIKKLEDIQDIQTKNVQIEDKDLILKVMHSLQNYAKEKDIECNFVIIKASQFNSGFGKPDFSKIKIIFKTNKNEEYVNFGDIVSSLKAKEKERDDFFYLFYKRKDSEEKVNIKNIDNKELCERLIRDVAF